MAKITQLYEKLELFSDGDPVRHTLFVLGQLLGTPDQLLLIDPPADAASRFSLPANSAALFTREAQPVALPLIETQAQGVAHVRIGQHLLDIHSQPGRHLVSLPPVGLLLSGDLGSDLSLPLLVEGEDGGVSLEALRLLARLVRQRPPRLFMPQFGSFTGDAAQILERLANDVAYLHGLRRVIPGLVQRGEPLPRIQQIGQTLLPEKRRTPHTLAIHQRNVALLHQKKSGVESP
jgi:hypothetical protein